MDDAPKKAAVLVAKALAARQPKERATLLRELMAHAAAALEVIEGREEAAMSVYRLADAIVVRGRPDGT